MILLTISKFLGNIKTKLKTLGATKFTGNKAVLTERFVYKRLRPTFISYYIFRLNYYNNLNRSEQLCGVGTCVPPTVLIEFPENAIFNDLLANNKSIFKCITLDEINRYFIERNAEASRLKGRGLGMNMMLERISVHLNGRHYQRYRCGALNYMFSLSLPVMYPFQPFSAFLFFCLFLAIKYYMFCWEVKRWNGFLVQHHTFSFIQAKYQIKYS